MVKVLAGLMAILCVAGCASRYPMGLTRDQWEALPPERQAEYQARQAEINHQQRMQRAAAQAERDRAEQERLQVERERIADLYANARYGDIVRVSIEGGSVEYYGKRYPYHPVAFELVKGESKVIQVTRSGQVQQSIPFTVRLAPDGHTIFFNEGRHRMETLVKRDWERGQTYMLSNAEAPGTFALPGGRVFVKYVDLSGAPQRVVIEHR